jgi:type I restriction enzyme M protein
VKQSAVGQFGELPYENGPGFCKSATLAETAAHDYILTPGRYVGAADVEDDGMPFEEKMKLLVNTLTGQFLRANHLENLIKQNLEDMGYGN